MSVLEVKGLRKTFSNLEVLRGVDFSLEKGEVLSIIGSSGGGKTTLLRCLNFLEKADGGEIKVNSEVVFSADGSGKTFITQDAQSKFGLVFQQFNLFPQYSVIDNLTLAPRLKDKTLQKADAEEKAMELLQKVGLTDKAKYYPCQLSGGQQQRVAIARAMMLQPEILCFDEPTSALDPELTGEVLRVIRGLKSNDRTMIIVTHEMQFAKNVSDKVMFMTNGLIDEIGTPKEVFDNPKSEKLKAFLKKEEI